MVQEIRAKYLGKDCFHSVRLWDVETASFQGGILVLLDCEWFNHIPKIYNELYDLYPNVLIGIGLTSFRRFAEYQRD